MSELLIPPSTANSDNLCPLSFSMASRIALVWKQAASMVARAMCPRWVCCVIPTGTEISTWPREQKESEWGRGEHTDGSTGVVDPVRSEQTTEGCHEYTSTAVGNAAGQITDLARITEETQVVHQEGYTTTGDSHATFQRINRIAFFTHLETDGGEQAVLGNDGLVANVVKQETTSTIGVLGHTRREGAVAKQGRRLVAHTAGDRDAI